MPRLGTELLTIEPARASGAESRIIAVVVPAAAHSAFNRALVLSADEEVTLDVLPTSGQLALEVDGTIGGHLSPGDRLTVTALRAAARVVRLGTTTFYERARRKLRVNGSAEVD